MPRKRAAKETDFPENKASALRVLGADWLRYEQGCYLISCERSPWAALATKEKLSVRPDILGLNKQRMTIEVEIKVDKQDFNHDFNKKHRSKLMDEKSLLARRVNGPSQLYYLVPNKLVDHVMTHTPVWAGVLTVGDTTGVYSGLPKLRVVRKATKIHNCRLGLRETVIMAKDMAGTITTVLRDNLKRSLKNKRLEDQVIALGGEVKKKRKRRSKEVVVAEKMNKAKRKKAATKKRSKQ